MTLIYARKYKEVTVEVLMSKFMIPSVIILAVLIYGNTIHSPFVFDDEHQIVNKTEIRELSRFSSIARLLKPRAVVDLTFALNYGVGGLHVTGYHLINILIHGLNGGLVFLLARIIFEAFPITKKDGSRNPMPSKMGSVRIKAFLVAMIFIAHPIQTQAVTYVVQRYTSMAATFYLASILLYIMARRIQQDQGKRAVFTGLFILSLCCGLAAFLCKQHTASLPLAILLMEYMIMERSRQGWKKRLSWLGSAFVLWGLFVLHVSGLFRGGVGGEGLLEDVSRISMEIETVGRWQYLCTQFNVLVIYIRLLFFPVNQCLDYAYPFKKGFFDGTTPFAALFILGLLWSGFRMIKKAPLVSLSIFWFFITLSVESTIIPIRDALFEHRLYLPLFGFALFLVTCLYRLFTGRERWAVAISAALVLTFSGATILRNGIWQSEIRLWEDAVGKRPLNPRAQHNLGLALARKDEHGRAISHFFEALRLKPLYPEAHHNLGVSLHKEDRWEEAKEHFSEALRLKSDFSKAHNSMGYLLVHEGKLQEAIHHFHEALRVNPDFAMAMNNLGSALERQGRLEEAVASYADAVRIKPDYVSAYNNLGSALKAQGKLEEALSQYRTALNIDPESADAHNNLGVILASRGKVKEAVAHFSNALAFRPDFVEAHFNLGLALKDQDKIKDSVIHLMKSLEIDPSRPEAHYHLGIALEREGNLTEAEVHLLKATQLREDYTDALSRLGRLLASQERSEEAALVLREVIRLEPDRAEARNNLGVVLIKQNLMDQAARHFSEALRIRPDYAEAHNNLGSVLARQGQLKEAAFHFSEALRIKPDYREAEANLALALRLMDQSRETKRPSRP
jgi:tetratricopeptide (TPR) repeat protein